MQETYAVLTPDGTKTYPLHSHPHWEIMYYVEGEGQLATARGDIPFTRGTIVLVPPHILHGSVSEGGFKNISVGGNFQHLLLYEYPIVLQDTPKREGETLARMLLENCCVHTEYTAALTNAYICFLLQSIGCDRRLERTIQSVLDTVAKRFSDPTLNITALLVADGYTEDYARAAFKKHTTLTPVQFLTRTRIRHAQHLFEVYGKSITVAQAGEACGFTDAVYFSKRFKQFVGVSPDAYKKQCQ